METGFRFDHPICCEHPSACWIIWARDTLPRTRLRLRVLSLDSLWSEKWVLVLSVPCLDIITPSVFCLLESVLMLLQLEHLYWLGEASTSTISPLLTSRDELSLISIVTGDLRTDSNACKMCDRNFSTSDFVSCELNSNRAVGAAK